MKIVTYQVLQAIVWGACATVSLAKSPPGTTFDVVAKDADGVMLEFQSRFGATLDKPFWGK